MCSSDLIGSYKSTGKLPVFDVVEIAALESLGAALAKDGDTEGLALLSPLSRHVVTRKGAHFSLDQLLNPQQLDKLAKLVSDKAKEVHS